jgi:hypothetical protein
MVGVHVTIPMPMAFHNFGRWKRSSVGDGPARRPSGVGADYVMPTMR